MPLITLQRAPVAVSAAPTGETITAGLWKTHYLLHYIACDLYAREERCHRHPEHNNHDSPYAGAFIVGLSASINVVLHHSATDADLTVDLHQKLWRA